MRDFLKLSIRYWELRTWSQLRLLTPDEKKELRELIDELDKLVKED